MITDDVSQTVERSGGGPGLSSPGVWTECAQQTMPEDIQIQECPHGDDLEIQPLADTIRRLEDGMPAKRIVSTSVGSLAGGCGSGRGDPRGRCFRNGTPLYYNGSEKAD